MPLTWRAESRSTVPLLVGTLEHSVLGTRYGYDAVSDPVFLTEIERVIREGDGHAEIHDAHGNALPLTSSVQGSGAVDGTRVEVCRRLDRSADTSGDALGTLVIDWVDEQGPRRDVLAVLR